MNLSKNKASDKIGFNVDEPICLQTESRIDNTKEFSFFDFALGINKSPVPLNFSFNKRTEQTPKVRSTKRGSGRRDLFLFCKELVKSNSLSQEWVVDKTPQPEEDLLLDQSDEEEDFPMVNLKDYLKPCVLPTKIKKKKVGFTRANVDFPYCETSVTQVTPHPQDEQQVSAPLKLAQQHKSVIKKQTMASSTNSSVPASGLDRASASIPAFSIPMLTPSDYNNNITILKSVNIEADLASVAHKFVSVNVLQHEEHAFKQFCVNNHLTILNSCALRVFVPTVIDKIQFLVTRKGRAPNPPKAVEHNEKPAAIEKMQVKTASQQASDFKPKLKRKSNRKGPTVSHVSQKAQLALRGENGPRTAQNKKAENLSPYKGKIDHSILQEWDKLSPEQVLIARETSLQEKQNHREEVLASVVKDNKSFADCLEGVNKVMTTFSYLQIKREEAAKKLKGIPHKAWTVIGNNQDKIRAYYKQLFRSSFYTLRARWIKIQVKGEDMNPYITDFGYFWRQINVDDVSKIFDNIKTWEQKVIAFYPKSSAASEWFKQPKYD
uniref:Uncharacterized protein n=1 Tax=Bactrocera dorsalis TaxID=27457 RepID=A0A034VBK3_BACDO